MKLLNVPVLGALAAWLPIVGSGVSASGAETYEAPLAVRAEKASGEFAVRPAVRKKTAGGWAIAFGVKAPTDVEVAVLDANGKVVRHLAAGLLGKHAPHPLTPDSLSQELHWDGKDNFGRPIQGARVRVRLGMEVGLDKYLGRNDRHLGTYFRGMTVGPEGELYVLHSRFLSNGRTEVRVMDREGKYLRTILPYPASTPAERAEPMGRIEVEGQPMPILSNGHSQNLAPLLSTVRDQQMLFSPRGHLVFVSGLGNWTENGPPQHLLALHPRGGAPKETGYVGPRIRKPLG